MANNKTIKINQAISFSKTRIPRVCSWCLGDIPAKTEVIKISPLEKVRYGGSGGYRNLGFGAVIHKECLEDMGKGIADAFKNKDKYAIINQLEEE